jgi:hypothetical protein
MQHLVSIRREEEVADEEVPKEDSLHRNRQSADVGSLFLYYAQEAHATEQEPASSPPERVAIISKPKVSTRLNKNENCPHCFDAFPGCGMFTWY